MKNLLKSTHKNCINQLLELINLFSKIIFTSIITSNSSKVPISMAAIGAEWWLANPVSMMLVELNLWDAFLPIIENSLKMAKLFCPCKSIWKLNDWLLTVRTGRLYTTTKYIVYIFFFLFFLTIMPKMIPFQLSHNLHTP